MLDIKWNKQLVKKVFMSMMIQLDVSGLLKIDVVKMVEMVRKMFNEKGYIYLNGMIDCMQKDGDGGIGYVKYLIGVFLEIVIQLNDVEELGS